MTFNDRQGKANHGRVLRLSSHAVGFELCDPDAVVRVSEALREFQIKAGAKEIYAGRAVVRDLVNVGTSFVCEANLDDLGFNAGYFSTIAEPAALDSRFEDFVRDWEQVCQVRPEFKLAVADIQSFLLNLRRWLEHVELGLRRGPASDLAQRENEAIEKLRPQVVFMLDHLFARFEASASTLDAEALPRHRSYAQRLLHPIVLCAPFANRTYQKPLGFAGDYEMVNMILRDPREGASLFAKLLNVWLLQQDSAAAHRNRLEFLHGRLTQETLRCRRQGRPTRILNLGCGPAGEIQKFLTAGVWADQVQFKLHDSDEETVEYTTRVLGDICRQHNRRTQIEVFNKSAAQIIKESARRTNEAADGYDFIYCSGLFDYLPDHWCRKLMNIFWSWTRPGGLVLATNVTPRSPNRSSLELLLEWHLIYRDTAQFATFAPDDAAAESVRLHSDDTGVNIILEARKPDV